MRKYSFIIGYLLSMQLASAQLTIGKSIADGCGILDFGTEARGIVLMPVNNTATMVTPAAGTIAFDGATGSLRYFDGTSWSTAKTGGMTGGTIMGTDGDGVIIGANSSSASGALILESTSKALILPRLSSGQFLIKSPRAGMLFYDTSTKKVNVYNGNSWTEF